MMETLLARVSDRFHPGSFSFVMATGIISVAAFQQHLETTARILYSINKAAYLLLLLLLVVRSVRRPRTLLNDMTVPSRATALFTLTAATCILGSQFVILSGNVPAGLALWIAGSLFWTVFSYIFVTALIVATKENKTGENELNGSWLIYVVGTQSLAILAMLISPYLTRWQEGILLEAASLHLVGSALYCILIILIVRRMTFLELSARDLVPSYWINMGAAAISTLAGADLILHAGSWGFLQETLSALKWTTMMFWSLTTWWLPFMVILTVWRYGYRRFPVTYEVQQWSMVFPLGMYSACSSQFGKAAGIAFLVSLSHYWFYLALTAWVIVFWGMAVMGIRVIRQQERTSR